MSGELWDQVWDLLLWGQKHNIWLQVFHVPGVLNVNLYVLSSRKADGDNRPVSIALYWTLSCLLRLIPEVFENKIQPNSKVGLKKLNEI
jgi:hypothetical protein